MVFKIKTSKKTMMLFEEMAASSNYAPFILSKLSISLSVKSKIPLEGNDFKTDSLGLELNRQTITGEWDDLYKCLIEMSENSHIDDDEYFQKYLDAGIASSYELYEVGTRLMNRGDYEHAVSYFQTALEQEEVPNKVSILKNMVIAYEGQRDFASAKDALERYLELNPDDETAVKEMTFLSSR